MRRWLIVGAAVLVGGIALIAYSRSPSLLAESVRAQCAEAEGEAQISCFAEKLTALGFDRGWDISFGVLKHLYDRQEGFARRCGRITAAIGKNALAQEPDYRSLQLTPKTISCNYNFFLSYAENLTAENGAEEGGAFCSYIAEQMNDVAEGTSAECFRGVGNAIGELAGLESGPIIRRVTRAVDSCDDITSMDRDFYGCTAGLFNALGHALARTDELKENPLSLCRRLNPQIGEICEGNFKWAIVDTFGDKDFSEAVADVRRQYRNDPYLDDAVSELVFTLAYVQAADSLPNPSYSSLITSCEGLEQALRDHCVQGHAVAFAKSGSPGSQHTYVFDFCTEAHARFGKDIVRYCPGADALTYLRGAYSEEAFQAACSAFDELTPEACSGLLAELP